MYALADFQDYNEGLLPTPNMVIKLIDYLHKIAIEERLCNENEWKKYITDLDSPELSWKHSLTERDDGPHGFLVREVIINRMKYGPLLPIPDYTEIPEYVQNLCSGFPDDLNDKLEELYKKRTNRAIVVFRSNLHLDNITNIAIKYAHEKLLYDNSLMKPNTGYSGGGIAVPKTDIIRIDWLNGFIK